MNLTCNSANRRAGISERPDIAYGHAERNLTAIRPLEAGTRRLLGSLAQLNHEQSAWLKQAATQAIKARDLLSGSANRRGIGFRTERPRWLPGPLWPLLAALQRSALPPGALQWVGPRQAGSEMAGNRGTPGAGYGSDAHDRVADSRYAGGRVGGLSPTRVGGYGAPVSRQDPL